MQEPKVAAGEQAALPPVVRVGGSDIAMWPDGQRIEALSAPLMAVTHFADSASYHGDLAATILEMERDPAWRDWIFKGGCGMKVRRPLRDLVHLAVAAHAGCDQENVFKNHPARMFQPAP